MALSTLRLRRAVLLSSACLRQGPLSAAPSSKQYCTPPPLGVCTVDSLNKSDRITSPFIFIPSASFRSSSVSSSSRFRDDEEKISPDTILFEGCDYNHWLITMDFPKDPKPTPEEMVDTYVKTCAKGLGCSIEEAMKKMYACSTTTYHGFQAVMTEEESEKFRGIPGVVFILPDSYIDSVNKEYGGDKYINGTIIPRPPPFQHGRRNEFKNDRRQRYSSGDGRGFTPQQTYGPPGQNDSRGFSPPSQNDGRGFTPQQTYGPPGQNDSRGFGPPSQNDGRGFTPQQTYGPPGQNDSRGFGPPSQNDGRGYAQPPHHDGGGYRSPGQNDGGGFGPTSQNDGSGYARPPQNVGWGDGQPGQYVGRGNGPPGYADNRGYGPPRHADNRGYGSPGGGNFTPQGPPPPFSGGYGQGDRGNFTPQGRPNLRGDGRSMVSPPGGDYGQGGGSGYGENYAGPGQGQGFGGADRHEGSSGYGQNYGGPSEAQRFSPVNSNGGMRSEQSNNTPVDSTTSQGKY